MPASDLVIADPAEDAGADRPELRTKRTAIVVLGMHRSGTSAMAGMLGALGCALPQRLMPATEDNPKGYFESLGAYRANDDILASAGSDWSDWAPVNPGWADSPVAPEFRQRLINLVEDDFGGEPLIVLKDPRMCRLLPIWQQAFAAAAIQPHYILPHRHPVEVAASLHRRDGWRTSYGLLVWLRNTLDAEAATRGSSRLFTSYDRLLADWRAVVDRIEATLDLRLPRRSAASEAEVDAFLSPDLRRNVVPEATQAQQDRMPGWVTRSLAIAERFAQHGEDAEGRAELDAINADFTASAAPFTAALPTAQAVAQLKADRDKAVSRLADTEAALDKANSLEAALRDLAETERARHANAEAAARQDAAAALAEAQRAAASAIAEARQRAVEEAEAVRAAFEQSRAWRITRPLRYAALMARGRHKG